MVQVSQVSTLKSAFITRATVASQISLILTGTVFLAVMAQISIPIPGSPVPLTGQTLGVLLLGTAYGAGLGFSTIAFYLLMGMAGAPIFSSGTSGIERIVGPTGGYLVGMLISSLDSANSSTFPRILFTSDSLRGTGDPFLSPKKPITPVTFLIA